MHWILSLLIPVLSQTAPASNAGVTTESVIKITAGIGAMIGTLLAVFKFLDEKRKSNETARIEARKPFSTRQQEIFLELVNTTAIISTRYGKDDWEPAFQRFWTMYWGVIPIVADEEVSIAVDHFADTLDDLKNEIAIRNASMNLARACRQSLGESWDRHFAPYERRQRANRG